MAVSKAHIKASAKYNLNNYKSFTVNLKIEDYNSLNDYCVSNNVSKNAIIKEALKAYLEQQKDKADNNR